jgi:hypothetical protein
MDAVWAAAGSVEVRPVESDGTAMTVVVDDATEIAELASLLVVDLAGDGFVCMCWGDVRFTVRSGEGQVIGLLTLHLGSGLDSDQWGGQLPLTRETDLMTWLAERRLVTTG